MDGQRYVKITVIRGEIMISSQQVIDKIKENTDLLLEILEEFNFHDVTINKKELRCAYKETGNPTSVRIALNTLHCSIYPKSAHGSLYKLLILQSELSFLEVHAILVSKLDGVEFENITKPSKKLFGGVFDDTEQIEEYKTYPESTLNKYERCNNLRFYKDNIFLSTQNKFELYYDNSSNRIVIPWRDEFGSLIGTVGRLNFESVNNKIPKYIALDKFKKTNFLFGLNLAIDFIIEKDTVIIVESEKSCMKLNQMGFPFVVAVGSHNISPQQILILKKYCSNVIVAFDEELTEDEIKQACCGLIGNFKTVAYIYDEHNEYLPEGSKLSPADLNINNFKSIMTKCKKRLDS